MTPDTPALEVTGLGKTFGATVALRDVSLRLMRGEIHALCGQNGSGKSTVIKVLSGYHEPDPGGALRVSGEEVSLPLRPGQPEELGITFVHQDLALAPELSVLDNLFVSHLSDDMAPRVRWRELRRRARAQLDRFGVEVPLDIKVKRLSHARQAVIAIARALARHGDDEELGGATLVLDEPTAHLPGRDVDMLMGTLHKACDRGVAVLLVTHRLDEVLAHSDRVTVLRDGARVASQETASLDHDSLVELLLGRALGNLYPESHRRGERERLRLVNVSTAGAYDVGLTVNAGEIVGITGLIGSGFEEIPYAIFGAQERTGEAYLDGSLLTIKRPRDAMDAGIGLVPAGRLTQSGVSIATLVENVTLPTLDRFCRGPLLGRRRELRHAAELLRSYDVRPPGPATRQLSKLSGGNQQKLLLAKWLETDPRVFLLHEPTQGVDIGSRQQLFTLIERRAEDGCAVLLASTDYADLASLCHRVFVFNAGRVTAEVGGAQLTEDRIAELCLRGSAAMSSGA